MVRIVPTVVFAVLVSLAPVSRAAAAPPYVSDLGYGMAAAATNLFYLPAKMLYALGGGVVGTLAYGLTAGNLDAAHNVWSPSLGGTWVLSAEMMAGKKSVLFSGETYERSSD